MTTPTQLCSRIKTAIIPKSNLPTRVPRPPTLDRRPRRQEQPQPEPPRPSFSILRNQRPNRHPPFLLPELHQRSGSLHDRIFEYRATTPPRTTSFWRYAAASERRSPSPPRRYSPQPVRRRSPSPYRSQFTRGRSPVRESYTPPRQIYGRSRSRSRGCFPVGASQSVYDWESGVGGFTGSSNRRSGSRGSERRWTDPGV